ncbi:MAG: metallophosphoesterase [Pseudomonadota bacterium]
MLTRRTLLKAGAATAVSTSGIAAYSVVVEPRFRLHRARYRVQDPKWTGQAPLKIVALADFHFNDPWMPLSRVKAIVEQANYEKPDIILMLGDYAPGLTHVPHAALALSDWSVELAKLTAPLGVYGILGNHDWWTDGPAYSKALGDAGVNVLSNRSLTIDRKEKGAFTVSGTDSAEAEFLPNGGHRDRSNINAALEQARPQLPIIHIMHEPDLFASMPERVFLSFAGHTHGGQVNLPFVGRPVIPSRYGQRYAYGHIKERGQHLIVSGGLGVSMAPVRFRVPPEITIVDVIG